MAGRKQMKTKKVLKERGKRYGEFRDHAKISQQLQTTIIEGMQATGKVYNDIPPYIHEALILICHKLARVANGDPMYADNFVDIAGYSQLVVNELEKKGSTK